MEEAAFDTRGVEHMFSEAVVLPDHQMVIGLLHVHSADEVRVCVFDGQRIRHMSDKKAEEYADYLDGTAYALALAPVSDALRKLTARIGEINSQRLINRAVKGAYRDFKFEQGRNGFLNRLYNEMEEAVAIMAEEAQ